MDDSVLNSAKSFIPNWIICECLACVRGHSHRHEKTGTRNKTNRNKNTNKHVYGFALPSRPYIAGISLWMTEWFCIRQTNNWHLWNVRPTFGWCWTKSYAALICSQVFIFAFTRRLLLLLSSPLMMLFTLLLLFGCCTNRHCAQRVMCIVVRTQIISNTRSRFFISDLLWFL